MSSNDQKLRAIFDEMLEGVVVYDRNGHVVDFNSGALRILGVSKEELLERAPGDPRWRLLTQDFSPMRPEDLPVERVRRSNLALENQLMGVYTGSDELKWLRVTAVPHQDEILLTFRDVTREYGMEREIRKMSLQLRSRERFLNSTLGAMPLLVSYVDRDLVYRYVNETYSRWHTRPIEECIGRSVPELLGPESFESVRVPLARALDGEQVDFEMPISFPDGRWRYLKVEYIPDRDERGVNGIFVISQDFTEYQLAREEVQNKKRELNLILENIPGMVSHWSHDLKNIHANTAWANFFGTTPEKMLGRGIEEVSGREMFAEHRPYIEKVLRGVRQSFEREAIMPDGEVRQFIGNYVPHRQSGQVLGFFIFVTDVSEVKRLEHKLVHSAKMSALGEMAGGIAHEINTPLCAMALSAETMREELEAGVDSKEALKEGLRRIERTIFRVADIVKILRSFARDGAEDRFEDISIREVVEESMALCAERFKTRGVRLSAELPSEDLRVNGQKTQLIQVLINLLNNAFDAARGQPDPWVAIRVCEEDGEYRIEVIDSGEPIPDAIAGKLMQPFFTTKPVGEGMGIGLSTSLGIVRHHGGDLVYDREAPHTTFAVKLKGAA